MPLTLNTNELTERLLRARRVELEVVPRHFIRRLENLDIDDSMSYERILELSERIGYVNKGMQPKEIEVNINNIIL